MEQLAETAAYALPQSLAPVLEKMLAEVCERHSNVMQELGLSPEIARLKLLHLQAVAEEAGITIDGETKITAFASHEGAGDGPGLLMELSIDRTAVEAADLGFRYAERLVDLNDPSVLACGNASFLGTVLERKARKASAGSVQRRILITGGPVHAYIDAVKIVTNRFKGGLMAELAFVFAEGFDCEVTYLCAKGSSLPKEHSHLKVIVHDGFNDYRRLVSELAPLHTDVILGAAVANLIPANPWKGKFPSHNYKPGDIVSVDFMVAPRIIDEVKRAAPAANLFGFKLLANVPHEDLVAAAYGIVLESKAMAVIANDASALDQKFVVTKERGVHPVARGDLADYLWTMMSDTYYRTVAVDNVPEVVANEEADFLDFVRKTAQENASIFPTVEGGLVFGTIARRSKSGGFWTTARGKKELTEATWVRSVDHESLVIEAGPKKATLNAPLLDTIFRHMPEVHSIVHGHRQIIDFPTVHYAPPGTIRDSRRMLHTNTSFNIAEHGCFFLLDEDGWMLNAPEHTAAKDFV